LSQKHPASDVVTEVHFPEVKYGGSHFKSQGLQGLAVMEAYRQDGMMCAGMHIFSIVLPAV